MTTAAQWEWEQAGLTLRDFHQNFQDLLALRDAQHVSIHPESLSFELRLDATDKLNDGDRIAGALGIGPQLATLELMAQPKREGVLGSGLKELLPAGFSFTLSDKPPMVLFVWGRKRVLPVNINRLTITESEFNPGLQPIRATVAVDLTVIEGPNAAYLYTKAAKEASSGLHLANLQAVDVSDVVIPR